MRDALDTVLVNRLPDVEIITTGGPGLPALAASYARSRTLELIPVLADHQRYPGSTQEKRDERLVELADAVVLVGGAPDEPTRQLLARLRAKCVPVRVVSVIAPRVPDAVAEAEPRPRFCGLPD